jgi:hypothetical protein
VAPLTEGDTMPLVRIDLHDQYAVADRAAASS